MVDLFLGIRPPIEARYAAQAPAPPTRGGTAGNPRNQWPLSVGTGGRITSESVAGKRRNTHSVVFEAASALPAHLRPSGRLQLQSFQEPDIC